jgi:hypothetical protein
MILTPLRHLHHLFTTHSVVNVLFKSMLKLLFFKKNQYTKKIRKIKICKGSNMKRKKLKDQFAFRVTWSTSLLGDLAIKNKKTFFPINRYLKHTQKRKKL